MTASDRQSDGRWPTPTPDAATHRPPSGSPIIASMPSRGHAESDLTGYGLALSPVTRHRPRWVPIHIDPSRSRAKLVAAFGRSNMSA